MSILNLGVFCPGPPPRARSQALAWACSTRRRLSNGAGPVRIGQAVAENGSPRSWPKGRVAALGPTVRTPFLFACALRAHVAVRLLTSLERRKSVQLDCMSGDQFFNETTRKRTTCRRLRNALYASHITMHLLMKFIFPRYQPDAVHGNSSISGRALRQFRSCFPPARKSRCACELRAHVTLGTDG